MNSKWRNHISQSSIHGLLIALTLLVYGCNKSDRPELAQLTGTVTFQGEPLKSGTIVFESTGNRPANGRIEDGQIVGLTTFEENDGIPVGNHRVAVFATSVSSDVVAADPSQDTASGDNYMGAAPSLLPDKYSDPANSGLTAEIQSGTNSVTFELK